MHFPQHNNAFGFQGNQPIVVLKGDGGQIRYTPRSELNSTNSWQKVVVNLDGNGLWERQVIGTLSMSNIDQFEIHYDTCDAGFSVGLDAVHFDAFTGLTTRTYHAVRAIQSSRLAVLPVARLLSDFLLSVEAQTRRIT